MTQGHNKNLSKYKDTTRLLHSGRDPEKQFGFVNPPIVRGSTVIYPTLDHLQNADMEYTYGRQGTPTIKGLEQAIADLEGGDRTVLCPSGLNAISLALTAFTQAGDHILVTDSVYRPTRRFCEQVLKKYQVETTYYDPVIGSDIEKLIRPNTKIIFTESPGSQTMEMQDIPAISAIAKEKNILVALDNTWASPLYYKPFDHGVDIAIQACTKYVVGHADAMLGSVTVKAKHAAQLKATHTNFGLCPGPEDAFIGLRGMRTLGVRLERHWRSALKVAQWLESRPEVKRVMYPALESDPGHEIWKRDYLGASGLFSIILHPVPEPAVAAFLDNLALFGLGYSWGGYECLVIPFDPSSYRSATQWSETGQALRFHIGLDDADDLIADLESGFEHMGRA